MVSTFLSYRLYTSDMAKSVQRTLADSQVAREQTYYRDNIGKVTSVDDFLKDQRLYTYAMKAYGLEDMTYAKAFMRKVLESDVTDSQSFVRKLVDQRYLAFAQAFNFTSDGTVAAGTAVVQDKSDVAETVGLYSEQRVRAGTAAAAEVEYYKARMPSIASADQLVSDPRLFDFALTAFGIDASIASESAIKAVLSGDLSVVAGSPNLAKYQKLAAAFSFDADGSVPAGGQAQSADQLNLTIDLNYEATGAGASPAAAAFRTGLYTSLIGGVTTADELISNSIMRDYALVGAGIDPLTVSPAMMRDILTSDLSDAASFANTKPEYARLASMFNFNGDGTLDPGEAAQSLEQQDALVDGYFANYQAKALSTEELNTKDYRFAIGIITNVDGLVRDTRLFNYVMKAFGLDPAEETPEKIRRVLTSDLSSSTSFARLQRDERYIKLAEAFNFGSNGEAQGPLKAQFASAKSDTIARYTATLGQYDHQKAAGKAESDYYSAVVDAVETVDQLLADKRVVTYLKTAYGLDAGTLTSTLRLALTSDVNDPKSFANQPANAKYLDLAKAFNFASNGSAKRVAIGTAQDPNTLSATQDLYVRQTMEQRAGADNEGVRLALYFQRKASGIQSAYSILADKALLEVTMTALGIPDAAMQADIDVLAKMISSRIDLADFKDPAKVDKFLGRFAALYDIQNPQQSSPSIASILLGQDQGIMGQDLLTQIQSLKLTV